MEAFSLFVAKYKHKLKHVANRTNGELRFEDVVSEAWLLARKLYPSEALDELQNPEIQDQLMGKLYNLLVRRGDHKFRHAIRLGSGGEDTDEPSDDHPLMFILSSSTLDPLSELLSREETPLEIQYENFVDVDCSLAGAYTRLLTHFNKSWRKVAEHLGLSTSAARQHYKRAEFIACRQRSLPAPMPVNFLPGAWRKFQCERIPLQLILEFTYQLKLNFWRFDAGS
jgi:hypothetical protein